MTGLDAPLDPEDTMVVIGHPFGEVEVPLSTWIRTGPGPRPLIRPIAAYARSTGRPVPLSAIPLPYRNDSESRRAIDAGLIEDPWPTGEDA